MKSARTLWTADQIAHACCASYADDFSVSGVSIDTRTLQPGDLFIALQGPTFDGHDYIAQAIKAGAPGVLSTQPTQAPHIRVSDTHQALIHLAQAARRRFSGNLVAITGSVGKTSTRALCAAAFSTFAKTHATQGNQNNHVGVPLTLARMPENTEVAVIEIGMNHDGEISTLSRLAHPTQAIITAIDWVHSANLDGTLAGVARAKAEICHGLTGPLFAPSHLQDLLSPFLKNREVHWIRQPFNGTLALSRPTHAWNAALALAPVPDHHRTSAAMALARVKPQDGRGNAIDLEINGAQIQVIDDTYNASPASMQAALSQLVACEGNRKIAIVGHMAELANPLKHHKNLGKFLASHPVHMVLAVGKFHHVILDALPPTVVSRGFDTTDQVVPYLTPHLQTDDVVLVKASQSAGFSHVVANFKAAANQSH